MNGLSGGRDHGTIRDSIFHGFPASLERLQCDGTIARVGKAFGNSGLLLLGEPRKSSADTPFMVLFVFSSG